MANTITEHALMEISIFLTRHTLVVAILLARLENCDAISDICIARSMALAFIMNTTTIQTMIVDAMPAQRPCFDQNDDDDGTELNVDDLRLQISELDAQFRQYDPACPIERCIVTRIRQGLLDSNLESAESVTVAA